MNNDVKFRKLLEWKWDVFPIIDKAKDDVLKVTVAMYSICPDGNSKVPLNQSRD